MRYIKWVWADGGTDMPILGYSKIGKDDFEVEKFEMFRDGAFAFSTSRGDTGRTRLADQPVGSTAKNNKPLIGTKKTIWIWDIDKVEYDAAKATHVKLEQS